jgi:hypothetical protein
MVEDLGMVVWTPGRMLPFMRNAPIEETMREVIARRRCK